MPAIKIAEQISEKILGQNPRQKRKIRMQVDIWTLPEKQYRKFDARVKSTSADYCVTINYF